MKRGDIYWANLDPTIGAEIQKTRPVVIVSNNLNNIYSSTITILPITSSIKKLPKPYEVFLLEKEGGISNNSLIKANQIRTIDKIRLGNKIGNLSEEKILEIENAILIHLGIN